MHGQHLAIQGITPSPHLSTLPRLEMLSTYMQAKRLMTLTIRQLLPLAYKSRQNSLSLRKGLQNLNFSTMTVAHKHSENSFHILNISLGQVFKFCGSIFWLSNKNNVKINIVSSAVLRWLWKYEMIFVFRVRCGRGSRSTRMLRWAQYAFDVQTGGAGVWRSAVAK